MVEKRIHKRAKTGNRLIYISRDEKGRILDQGVGKTLNISQGGLLIKTKAPVMANYLDLTTFDIINEFIKIKGKVVYCREKAPDIFHIGISFKEVNEKIRNIVIRMIKIFHYTQKLNGNYSNLKN